MLNSFFNDSSILNIFPGDHDTAIFQNHILKNRSDRAAMAVFSVRGTADFGAYSTFIINYWVAALV